MECAAAAAAGARAHAAAAARGRADAAAAARAADAAAAALEDMRRLVEERSGELQAATERLEGAQAELLLRESATARLQARPPLRRRARAGPHHTDTHTHTHTHTHTRAHVTTCALTPLPL
jgi:hypothetical protein